MQIKNLFLMILLGLGAGLGPARAQTWTPTSAPLNFWEFVACSADCTKIIVAAVNVGPVLVSTNSGETWITNTLPISSGIPYVDRIWGMACSADGSTFVVNGWHEISFTDYAEFLYISTNSGATWFTNSIPVSEALTLSADGSTIIATGTGAETGFICISTNWGSSWSNINFNQPSLSILSIACSKNASTIVVGSSFSYPGYISTNFGANWASNSFLGYECKKVSLSADGSKIEAVNAAADIIYASTNFGTTWTTNDLPVTDWWGVASSADGNKLVAVAGNYGGNGPLSGPGPIYTGYSPPSPQLNLASSNGNLSFSWLVPSTNMVLQQNSDVATTNWATVTNPPTLNFSTLEYQLTLPPASPAGFYRLATP